MGISAAHIKDKVEACADWLGDKKVRHDSQAALAVIATLDRERAVVHRQGTLGQNYQKEAQSGVFLARQRRVTRPSKSLRAS